MRVLRVLVFGIFSVALARGVPSSEYQQHYRDLEWKKGSRLGRLKANARRSTENKRR